MGFKLNVKQTEHQLQKQIVYILRASGFLVIQTDVMIALKFLRSQKDRIMFIADQNSSGYTKGQSDLIIILPNGKVAFVEMKTEKGKVREGQKDFERRLKELGHEYYIWRSVEDCMAFIEQNKS